MSMLEKLVLPEIRELISTKDLTTLREILREWLPPDLAALVGDLEPEEQALVFRSLEMSSAADAFAYLEFEVQEHLVESLPIGEVVKILNGMAPDDRTRFLEELRPDPKHRLLSLLSPEERRVAESLLAYPEDSVGRLMTPDYIAEAVFSRTERTDHVHPRDEPARLPGGHGQGPLTRSGDQHVSRMSIAAETDLWSRGVSTVKS